MKKTSLFIATILMSASFSFSVTTDWSSAAVIKFDSTSLTASGSYVAYMVNVGASSWFNYIDNVDTTSDFTKNYLDSSGVRLTGGSSNIGKINPSTYVGVNDKNSYYGVVIVYGDYYNFSGIFQVPNVSDTEQDLPSWLATFTFSVNPIVYYGSGTEFATESDAISSIVKDGNPSGWYKFVPVPEPATGAMALAGLALLFRRKRK